MKKPKSQGSLKVVLPVTKRADPAPDVEKPVLSKRGRPKAVIKSKPSPLKSPFKTPPPRFSSTPKPKPIKKSVSLPSVKNVTIKRPAGYPLITKECSVVVERLSEKYLTKSSSGTKNIPAPKPSKKKPVPLKKLPEKLKTNSVGRPKKAMKPTKTLSGGSEATEENLSTSGDEGNHTTLIPSNVLETFGINNSMTEEDILPETSVSEREQVQVTLLDTPPPTSTCSSSKAAASQRAYDLSDVDSVQSCLLPDSSEYPAEVLTSPLDLISGDNPDLVGDNIQAVFNVSSTTQVDPLNTSSHDSSLTEVYETTEFYDFVTTNCDLLFGMNERLHSFPEIYNLDQLKFSNATVRRIAPYSMKLNSDEDKFFLYVAPIFEADGKFGCLVFGILDSYIIAYGGHYLVEKERLFSPTYKTVVDQVHLSSDIECKPHLLLLHVPNRALVGTEGYAAQTSHPHELRDNFLNCIQQVELKSTARLQMQIESEQQKLRALKQKQLREDLLESSTFSRKQVSKVCSTLSEKRIQTVFEKTNLPINAQSLERIKKSVKMMCDIPVLFGEFANFQSTCESNPEILSAYYVAHEGIGCLSFYQNAFVLGQIENRFVVGVVVEENLFIMATKRLYSRLSQLTLNMRPVVFNLEMIETIELPLWLSYELVLTLLEVRQILASPEKNQKEFQLIARSLGSSEMPVRSSNFSFSLATKLQQATSYYKLQKSKNDKLYKNWLQRMVDDHFTSTFRDSLCKFPENPCQRKNPMLFADNISKLWVHQVLRIINDMKTATLSDDKQPSDLSLTEFCTLNIDSFCNFFLPLFGMSPDFLFQCHTLDDKGLLSANCSVALRADQIGSHVQKYHILPLELDHDHFDKELQFRPFSLVVKKVAKTLPLSAEKCDTNTLNWVQKLLKRKELTTSTYIGILQTLKVPSANGPAGKLPPSQKRKRTAGGEDDEDAEEDATKRKSRLIESSDK